MIPALSKENTGVIASSICHNHSPGIHRKLSAPAVKQTNKSKERKNLNQCKNYAGQKEEVHLWLGGPWQLVFLKWI